MTTHVSAPRWWRLQFSLRWLLLAITAVGVGITVYRWPWVETVEQDVGMGHVSITTTTMRRGWNGKRQKDGPERELKLYEWRAEDRWYVAGELQRARSYVGGRMWEEKTFQAGTVQTTRTEERPTDEITGVWESSRQYGDEVVRQRSPWRNGQRHGLTTWMTIHGKQLQSAEFRHGRLVSWNGEPVGEALARWSKAAGAKMYREHIQGKDYSIPVAMLDQRSNLRNWFSQRLIGEAEFQYVRQPFDGYSWGSHGGLLVHYFVQDKHYFAPPEWQIDFAGRPMLEVLLENALAGSATLSFRFGTLCFVPINSAELNWRDVTGAAAVQFAESSQEARDWPRSIDASWHMKTQPAAQLKYLCEGTTIKVDTSAVDRFDVEPESVGMRCKPPPAVGQPRCHQFARVLYLAGYCVEQRGETLVVLPGRK